MKYQSIFIRHLVSPSMRFEITQLLAWIREQLNRACLWRWEIVGLPQPDDSPYDILYVGRKSHRKLAGKILGIENCSDAKASAGLPDRRVLVSELPIPGALCVPQYLRAIVPLGKPIEEVIATYDHNWRKRLRRTRAHYRVQQVSSEAEIDRLNREMLQPFAKARHGSSASPLSSDTVRRSALEYGRLDLVLFEDEVVACMLGNESIRKGKRYWLADRCGYPEKVFSDPKRLGEINSITFHLASEWATRNNYDYCDFALCFARPDDGLLQFKRRRGAELNRIGLRGYGYFHIRLPKAGAAQFLWGNPLFSVERNSLTLHLGLPDGISDDEFLTRYRQMGFGGLSKIYLHCAGSPDKNLLTTLRSLYKHQNPPPVVESVIST